MCTFLVQTIAIYILLYKLSNPLVIPYFNRGELDIELM